MYWLAGRVLPIRMLQAVSMGIADPTAEDFFETRIRPASILPDAKLHQRCRIYR
jgi:hypothetical protein